MFLKRVRARRSLALPEGLPTPRCQYALPADHLEKQVLGLSTDQHAVCSSIGKIPGVLGGMPMPFVQIDRRLNGGGALDAYDDELKALHLAGVRSVVSLLNIPSDATVYKSAGFTFSCSPMPDGGAPTMEQASEFVRFVTERRAALRPVAVHCQAGLGRTGTMLATYLISQGESAEAAIRQVREVEEVAVETPRQKDF